MHVIINMPMVNKKKIVNWQIGLPPPQKPSFRFSKDNVRAYLKLTHFVQL